MCFYFFFWNSTSFQYMEKGKYMGRNTIYRRGLYTDYYHFTYFSCCLSLSESFVQKTE